jgi:undecaprenyl diphosphate synthase
MHIGILIDTKSSIEFGNSSKEKSQFLKGYFASLERLIQSLLTTNYLTGITIMDSGANTKVLRNNLDYLLYLQDIGIKYSEKLLENSWNIRILGSLNLLDGKLKKVLMNLESLNQPDNTKRFQLCLNYSGKDEISRSMKLINRRGLELKQDNFIRCLDSKSDLDVILFMGGERKLKDFLLWQSANSFIYFAEQNWLEFNPQIISDIKKFWEEQK